MHLGTDKQFPGRLKQQWVRPAASSLTARWSSGKMRTLGSRALISALHMWRARSSWPEACMPSSTQARTKGCIAICQTKFGTCSDHGKNSGDEAAEVFLMFALLQVLQAERASGGCPSKCHTASFIADQSGLPCVSEIKTSWTIYALQSGKQSLRSCVQQPVCKVQNCHVLDGSLREYVISITLFGDINSHLMIE
jgi:hypothetical protein